MELQREALIDVAMGYQLETPQMNLEFVSLVTIPCYRINTKGLAYMTQDRFELAELFVDEAA